MKINILNIPEDGLDLQFSLEGESFSNLVPDEDKFGFSLGRVDVSGSIRRARQNVFFTGAFETIMETECSRCLEAVRLPLKANFSYTLLPDMGATQEEIELKTEDLDVGYYSGEVIELAPIIFEQVMLQIPMKVLCSEICRGLCPHCGINLNRGTCDCRSDFIDERLAVLKKFKV